MEGQGAELITGATGIVGTHLLLERTAAGVPVRALFRPASDRSIVERVFRHYRADADQLLARIHWVEGHLHDMDALEAAMEGVRHVYHTAAMVSFDPRDAKEMRRINVEGTANVVNAALAQGVERLCHVSSTAAIGEAPGVELRHEDLPWALDKDTSPYAVSKYEAELEIHRGLAEGLDAVMVNPCVILGPGLAGRSSMTLPERLRKGTSFYPTGSNAFVDARDVAACMVALMERGASGERYLLVGENRSYKDLFTAMSKAFGKPAPHRQLATWMLALAWRVERLRTLLTGGAALVTRSTVSSALERRSYCNEKVRALLGYRFRTMDEAVANVAAYLDKVSVG